jgi:hydrophobic/amphiphilic exporter-1 (mainly G- bacteria), HAE1 family
MRRMWISDFAIRKPLLTVVTMLALVAFGIAALINLQTDEFPDVAQPIVAVSIAYPGAAPDVVEREVVDPIEEAIFGISGVDRSRTVSNAVDGLAQFTVYFDYHKPVAEAAQDVRDAISRIRSDLPDEMKEPVISRFDPSELSILSLTITAPNMSPQDLTQIADPTVVRALRGVPGVADASVVGGSYPEMTVQLKPDAMQAADVGISDIVNALGTENLATPVGRLNSTQREESIRLLGRPSDAAAFRQVVVAERNGTLIRLGDVADVFEGHEEQRTASVYDGRAAVGIEVKKAKGYSTTHVVDQLKQVIAQIEPTLPGGARINIVRDAGFRVTKAVDNVKSALAEGALLTVLVVFLFLNSWRSTVITGLALPVSVLASFIAVWAAGFTLNTMSLLGLSLAIGILIDDAIVVRENIVRHVEMGKDHYQAAEEGTAEIGLAVAATTFSIICVFAPIAFMAGLSGQWFKPFALTIACAVLVSLFVSFSLDPMLSAYWPDPHRGEHRAWITRQLEKFNQWFGRMTERYGRLIAWALDHRSVMFLLAVLAFVGAIVLQVTVGGAGFVPNSDRSEIEVIVEAPSNANIEYTEARTEAVAALARRHPEVAYTYAAIGTALPMRTPGVDQADLYIKLVPKNQRSRSESQIGEELRREFKQVSGVTTSVFTGGFSGTIKDIQMQFTGPDEAELSQLAQQAEDSMRTVPGAVDVGLSVRGPRQELTVSVNRGLAGAMGLSIAQVAQAMRAAFAGIHQGDWVDPTGETRDVRIRLAPEARSRPADLAQLPITVPGAARGAPRTIPLGQVAQIGQGEAPGQIDHLNRNKVIDVEANVQGRALNSVVTDVQKSLHEIPLPPGYAISIGGQGQDQAEVFRDIFTALGIAVLLMYLVLVVQFGSFLDPLAILISLPLSLIGVVIALIITGDTLNIMSLIGVILLMGIVAKNAILLIDFAKWARKERGVPLREALIEAGRIRLRPILMTTFALIAGMIPVALGRGEGADFRAPLGRAVIGGVITSTFLTLLVIPTFYEILDHWRTRATELFARIFGGSASWRPQTGEHPVPHGAAMETGGPDIQESHS